MENSITELKHIFCVDDDPHMLNLIHMLLEDIAGVRVHLFTNAYQALDMMRDLIPDLVLLDVMMPEMNGVVAYKRMQDNEKLKNTKVVFVTARNRTSDLEDYKKLGVPTITKPFDPQEFKDLVGMIL